MPDLPEEAAHEATQAYLCAWTSGVVKPETLVRIVLEAAAPVLAAQARADERRKVAEEIATEIEAAGEKDEEFHYRAAMSRAAYIARQIGDQGA